MKKLKILPLEERIVLDAAAATDASAAHAAEAAPPPASILVVSSSVQDHDMLAQAAKSGVKVVQYDAQTTSLQTLSDLIHEAANGSQVASIALATDGTSGNFLVSASNFTNLASLTNPNDPSVANFWKNVAGNLLPNGSIAILGCQVGSGDLGQNTITYLESLINDQGTNLSVFASTDDTGSSLLGGNWLLERGNFDASAAFFDSGALDSWHHTLSPTENVATAFFDFRQSVSDHPDFFGHYPTLGTINNAMIEDFLNPDLTPVYDPIQGPAGINSAGSLFNWFHSTPGVNAQVIDTLTWTNNASGAFMNWGNATFDPINGQGLGNEGSGYNPNFAFSMHAFIAFPVGLQDFQAHVISNGDVWIFIQGVNNPFLIDMGGVHTTLSQDSTSVFGYPVHYNAFPPNAPVGEQANDGSLYQIDIFFASRNSDMPNLQIYIEDAMVFSQLYQITPIDTTTSEGGGTGSFSVVLPWRPVLGTDQRNNLPYTDGIHDDQNITQIFTINFGSSDPSEGQAPPSVSFNALNWNIPQVVVVHGVDDLAVDGTRPFNITSTFTSNYTIYETGGGSLITSGTGQSVAFTNADNDGYGVIFSGGPLNQPPAGLIVDEAATTTDTYTIRLSDPTVNNVVLTLSSSDTTEGLFHIAGHAGGFVSTDTITFTAADWNTPRTIQLRGVNDNYDDGNITWHIDTSVATIDPNYNGLVVPDVNAVTTDDDTAGISYNDGPVNVAPSGLTVTEGSASFTTVSVHLTAQPINNVILNLNVSDTTEGEFIIVGHAGGYITSDTITFTAGDWDVDRIIRIRSVDDNIIDGNIAWSLITSYTTIDPYYTGENPPNLAVQTLDDDVAGYVINGGNPNTQPTLTVTEAGSMISFSIHLSAQPTSTVVFNLAGSDATEGEFHIVTHGGGFIQSDFMTFAPGNWDVDRVVEIRGLDDLIDDGNRIWHLITSFSTTDTDFANFNPPDIQVTTTDDDTAGVEVQVLDNVTSEGGDTAQYLVRLTSQPYGDVTLHFDTTLGLTPPYGLAEAEGSLNTHSITFNSTNWMNYVPVTITGVNDFHDDGDQPYNVYHDNLIASDTTTEGAGDTPYVALFNASALPVINLVNIDDDTAGVLITPLNHTGKIAEEGDTINGLPTTAIYSVQLTSQPYTNVDLTVTSLDLTEVNLSPEHMTFTALDWNQPQNLFAKGFNDHIIDGDHPITLVANPDAPDPGYGGLPDILLHLDVIDNHQGPTPPLPHEGMEPYAYDSGFGSLFGNGLMTGLMDTGNLRGYGLYKSPGFIDNNTVTPDIIVSSHDFMNLDGTESKSIFVSLASAPSSHVRIDFSLEKDAGDLSQDTLVFTPENWGKAQEVIIHKNPDYADTNAATMIKISPAVSHDRNYHGAKPADVKLQMKASDGQRSSAMLLDRGSEVNVEKLVALTQDMELMMLDDHSGDRRGLAHAHSDSLFVDIIDEYRLAL